MRKVSETEYATALTATAAYKAFSAPYLQKNGWTVIPADAPKPQFAGADLDLNLHSTNKELFELERDMPERFSAYTPWGDQNKNAVTAWTGEVIARVTHEGRWFRNNFGGKWRQLTIRADWNQTYTGREYDSRQLVNFRRVKGG